MKIWITTLLTIIMTAPLAHANFGLALGDLFSAGEAGRERDRAFQQKQEQLAAQARANLITVRNMKIEQARAMITNASMAKENAVAIQKQATLLFNDLNGIAEGYRNILAGSVSAQAKVGNARVTKEQSDQDIMILKLTLKDLYKKDIQPELIAYISKVAANRGMLLSDYLNQAAAQMQTNSAGMKAAMATILGLKVSYQSYITLQNDSIRQQEEVIAQNTAIVNALYAEIHAENVAAEAVRMQAVKDEAARVAREQASQRATESNLERMLNKSIAR